MCFPKKATSTERKQESETQKRKSRAQVRVNFKIIFNRCIQDVCVKETHKHRKVSGEVQARAIREI